MAFRMRGSLRRIARSLQPMVPSAPSRPGGNLRPSGSRVRLFSSSSGGASGGGASSDPTKDPAIAAAIEKERAARLAAQPEKKLGRSLTETLSDHRDELFNILLAALLLVLTLKMLREKGEKLDEESDKAKRIKALEAELASLETAIVERVQKVLRLRILHSCEFNAIHTLH